MCYFTPNAVCATSCCPLPPNLKRIAYVYV
jgi:hypothetical protein